LCSLVKISENMASKFKHKFSRSFFIHWKHECGSLFFDEQKNGDPIVVSLRYINPRYKQD
jgi:hypothetical protein